MKRFIAVFLVLTLFFNFNTVAFGNIIGKLEGVNPDSTIGNLTPPGTTSSALGEAGEKAVEAIGLAKTIWDTIVQLLTFWMNPLIDLINVFPSIEETIFGLTPGLKLSFFSKPEGISVAGMIQKTTASIYNALRYLVTSIYIIILVYLAIRILISSIGRQKAHYKSLFQYWIIGLLMIFSFHWVMAFIIWLSDTFTTMFAQLAGTSFKAVAGSNMEQSLFSYLLVSLPLTSTPPLGPLKAFILPMQTAILIFLFIFEILIMIIYIKRLLFVALLIMVFPLVALSYVFDKIGDRKSQTFSRWFKEFTTNVFVQPIHAIILAFIMIIIRPGEAGNLNFFNIPIIGPFLACAMLALIVPGEKFLKQLFQISSSMGVGGGIADSWSKLAHQGMAMNSFAKTAAPFVKPFADGLKLNKDAAKLGLGKTMKDRATMIGDELKKHGADGIGEKGFTPSGVFKTGKGLLKMAADKDSRQNLKEALKKNDVAKKLAELEQKNPQAHAEFTKKLSDMGYDSYDAYKKGQANKLKAAIPAVATGAAFAAAGQMGIGLHAMGLVGKNTLQNAEDNTKAAEYANMSQKLEGKDISQLSDEDQKKLKQMSKRMYGSEKNIPSKEKFQRDLEFMAHITRNGGIDNPELLKMMLPSQAEQREKVFGKDGIWNSPDRDKYKLKYKDGNTIFVNENGEEEFKILGGPELKHSLSNMPIGGLAGLTRGERKRLIAEQVEANMKEEGYTIENGFSQKELDKIRTTMRKEVVADIRTTEKHMKELGAMNPILTKDPSTYALSTELSATQQINNFDDVMTMTKTPGKKALSDSAAIQFEQQAVAKINQSLTADKQITKLSDLAGKTDIDLGLAEGTLDAFQSTTIKDAQSLQAKAQLTDIIANPAAYNLTRATVTSALMGANINPGNLDEHLHPRRGAVDYSSALSTISAAAKSRTSLAPAIPQEQQLNTFDDVMGAMKNPETKGILSTNMAQFEQQAVARFNAVLPADKQIASLNDINGMSAFALGLDEATYSQLKNATLQDAQAYQAKQQLEDIMANPVAYNLTPESVNYALKQVGNINPNDLSAKADPNSSLEPDYNATLSALETLSVTRPYTSKVLQAAENLSQNELHSERVKVNMSNLTTEQVQKLEAIQNQGPMQLVYSGSTVTVSSLNDPTQEITLPSTLNLSEGETCIKAAVADPLNPSQIIQTTADVDHFKIAQPEVVLPNTGTPYIMDGIDLTQLPAGQIKLTRADDYCIITDATGNIVYSTEGLISGITDAHTAILTPQSTSNGREYIIDSISQVSGDTFMGLEDKASLYKIRTMRGTDEEKQKAANLQNLVDKLAIKLGLRQ